jgi:hypothetical protein
MPSGEDEYGINKKTFEQEIENDPSYILDRCGSDWLGGD